jgi:hypothetical protein
VLTYESVAITTLMTYVLVSANNRKARHGSMLRHRDVFNGIILVSGEQ